MNNPILRLIVCFTAIATGVYACMSHNAEAIDIVPAHNTFLITTELGTCYDMVKMGSGEVLLLGVTRCY